jgi:SAM-dependent methyltransferase
VRETVAAAMSRRPDRSPPPQGTPAAGRPVAGPDHPQDELAAQVARFYQDMTFPSRTAHPEYRALLPEAHGERLADFGCGTSLFHEALRGYEPSPVFLDLSSRALRSIEYGMRVQADLNALPFQAGTFDRILCIGVLHHLPRLERPHSEISRVHAEGGRFIAGVYAPRTLPAVLRRLHERFPGAAWKRSIFALTGGLVRLRYRLSGHALARPDAVARTRDFLEVPFVRYVGAGEYRRLAAAAGLTHVSSQRLAAMNVITFRKNTRGS